MKYFEDGDQIVVTYDDFENLQESPAIFIPKDSDDGRVILRDGLIGLPMMALIEIKRSLERQQGESI